MLVAILEVAALAAASLIVLYLFARWFPPFGDSLAFLCILACRILIKGEWILKEAGAYCFQAFEKTLKYPPSVTDDVWRGLAVVARLVWLLLSAAILFGEANNTLAALPALFGIPNDVPLPGGLSIASSMLFVGCAALYGAVLLEVIEVIPYACGLFPRLKKPINKVLGIVCLIGVILSVGVLVLFWVFRGWYLADPDSAQVFSPFIMGGLGLSVGGASILALWSFVVGLMGLASVVFWLAAALCTGLAVVFSLLPTLFDVLAVHLSGGERSVYERYLPGLAWQVPNTFFQKRSQVPAAAMHKEQATEGDGLLPQPKELEVSMVSEQLICITLNGVLGSRLLPSLKSSFAGVKGLIRCSGRVDTLNSFLAPVGLGADVSPSDRQRPLASTVKEQFDSVGNNIVQVYTPVRDLPSLHIHVLDCHIGLDAIHMLRDIKRRLPGIKQVVVTAVTPADVVTPSVQAFLTGLEHLWQEGVVTTTLVCDLSSLLVRSLGEEKFFAYVSRLLSDLVVCHKQSPTNLSALALFDQVGSTSAFVSLAVATASVAHGKTPARGWFARLFTTKAVTANIADLLRQALAVAMEVMTEPETWAWMKSHASSLACALVFDVPVSPHDGLFADFEQQNNQQVKAVFPNATTITISGNPVFPLRGSFSPFRIGVALLYPITLPAVEHPQPETSEKNDTADQIPERAVLPANTVAIEVPAQESQTLVNGHTPIKAVHRRGRPSTRKGK